jgi:hypothetical protein
MLVHHALLRNENAQIGGDTVEPAAVNQAGTCLLGKRAQALKN